MSQVPPSIADHAETFETWMRRHLALLEQALDAFVAPGAPPDLAAAMRYGVLGGGKRLRALLVLAGQQCVAAATPDGLAGQELALRAGCAVELIHAYSLIHDDMPCMDNDVLRRGKPTVHVQFGEAAALLAGDAMQALAFELLTPGAVEHDGEPAGPHSTMDAALVIQARLCATLARAAGPCGMAGGQAIDLAHVGKPMAADALRRMHRLKTGALLQASVVLGAQCVPQASAQALTALSQYGSAIGLAFQVVDDVLDATADSATLGKTAGKDAADEKPTYVSLMGVEAAQAYAGQLHAEALAALAASGLADTRLLGGLADLVVRRRH